MDMTSTRPLVEPAVYGNEFWRNCREPTHRLTPAPGFIEMPLHRSTADAALTFRFINVVVWHSSQAFGAAFRGWSQTITTGPRSRCP
jgi:heme-degrading monooxygenase HmoA